MQTTQIAWTMIWNKYVTVQSNLSQWLDNKERFSVVAPVYRGIESLLAPAWDWTLDPVPPITQAGNLATVPLSLEFWSLFFMHENGSPVGNKSSAPCQALQLLFDVWCCLVYLRLGFIAKSGDVLLHHINWFWSIKVEESQYLSNVSGLNFVAIWELWRTCESFNTVSVC